MPEESLSDWAERRQRRLSRTYRVTTLAPGPPQGAHVNPEAPRLISRWNGYDWEPVAVAANLAETRHLIYPNAAAGSGADTTDAHRGRHPGRHRRPPAG